MRIYLYTHANPVNNIDPSGRATLAGTMAMGAIVGSIANVTVYSVGSVYSNAGFKFEEAWASAIDGAVYGALAGGVSGAVTGVTWTARVTSRQVLKFNLGHLVKSWFGQGVRGHAAAGVAVGGVASLSVATMKELLVPIARHVFMGEPLVLEGAGERVVVATGWGMVTGGIVASVSRGFAQTRDGVSTITGVNRDAPEMVTFTWPVLRDTLAGTLAGSTTNVGLEFFKALFKEHVEKENE